MCVCVMVMWLVVGLGGWVVGGDVGCGGVGGSVGASDADDGGGR